MIIALEGIDGSGKSTQAERLVTRLKMFHPTTFQKFPDYATPIGKLIEKWLHKQVELVETDPTSLVAPDDALGFQCAMVANRLEHMAMLKDFSENHRKILVLDRYWGSGVAYGSGVDGLGFDHMRMLGHGFPQPDLTLYVDIDVDTALARQGARGRTDRYENQRGAMQQARNAYDRVSTLERGPASSHWVMVDGTQTIDHVEATIWSVVTDLLQRLAK